MIVWVSGSVFVILLIIIFWHKTHSREIYVPGEQVEGLTEDLSRSLPADHPTVTFTDVTEQAGIHFHHFHGTRTSQLPEDMGSGVAWGDYDNDGWQDLFLVNFAGPLSDSGKLENSPAYCQLYHNNHDGTFSEVSAQAGVAIRDFANAAAWADFNNDGWPDLSISCYGRIRLFRNNKNGTFTEVSGPGGLDNKKGYWTGLAWGDYNKDGYPDLYVCGYVKYSKLDHGKLSKQYNADVPSSLNPSSFPPAGNLLFRNNGDGTFTDVTEKLGVADIEGRSLSATWCDFNEDGWPDLYVANDVSDNVLYVNQGNGTFRELSHEAFVADYRGAMGLAIGDWDNDGDPDMVITHWIAQENALYDNQFSQLKNMKLPKYSDLKFMDDADRFGLGQIAIDYIGFGTFFFDYNNDGRLDLFIANGSTFEDRNDKTKLVPMKDLLFWNRNNKDGFYNAGPVSGPYFTKSYVGRGAAFADYDNDGDPDIFILNNDGPGILLRNDGGNKNNWLELILTTGKGNDFALGSLIRLSAGGKKQMRLVGSEGSYLSQNSLVQHFGLGNSTIADTVEIIWPDSRKEYLTGIKADRLLHIKEKTE